MLVLALLAGCSSSNSSSHKTLAKDEAAKLLLDRNWLDRMPASDRDHLFVYRFVPTMGGGVFQDRTLYKGTFELFKFAVDGDHITFDLLETGDKLSRAFQIEAVDGPAPFDLKLTVTGDPRGPGVYFGMRSETDRDGHVLDQRLAARAAELH